MLDVKARLPWYRSDWTDAWNYRVVPAMALIFLTKCVFRLLCILQKTDCGFSSSVLTGIAFSHDLIETTGEYGVSEVLVSSVLVRIPSNGRPND